MNRFKWSLVDAEPLSSGRRPHGWNYNSFRPPDPPGYGRRHGSTDMQLKVGNLCFSASAKTRRGKNITRRERSRASDEAIVSDDATGQNNPTPSQGPLDRSVRRDDASTPTQCGDCPIGLLKRWLERLGPLISRCATSAEAKAAVDVRFEAVLGKTRRTEFQRGRRKRDARPGGHLPRSPKGWTQRKPLAYSLARLLSTRHYWREG